MRYDVRHHTSYTYAAPVDVAYHVAHLKPRVFDGQALVSSELTVTPAPSRLREHVDHFGNAATWFAIDGSHREFTVETRSRVDVSLPAPASVDATPAWESVRDALLADGFPADIEASEFVHASPLVEPLPQARTFAKPSFFAGRPILAAARELTTRIYRGFKYTPGATDNSTPLSEVFERRVGVCQDFAHVQISVLRSVGLAARYVSGYVRTTPPGETAAFRGADASHAWVALWCGPEAGWVHLDPTNDCIVRDQHVIAAWGRDFADVSPVHGVILGGGKHTLEVAVELTPAA